MNKVVIESEGTLTKVLDERGNEIQNITGMSVLFEPGRYPYMKMEMLPIQFKAELGTYSLEYVWNLKDYDKDQLESLRDAIDDKLSK